MAGLAELEKRARLRSRTELKPTLTTVQKSARLAVATEAPVVTTQPQATRRTKIAPPVARPKHTDPTAIRRDVRRVREALEELPNLIQRAAVAHARRAVDVESITAEAARRVSEDRGLVQRLLLRLPTISAVDGEGDVYPVVVGSQAGDELEKTVARLETAIETSAQERHSMLDAMHAVRGLLAPRRAETTQESPARPQPTPDEYRESLRAKYDRPTDDENFAVWLEHTVAEYAERTGQ